MRNFDSLCMGFRYNEPEAIVRFMFFDIVTFASASLKLYSFEHINPPLNKLDTSRNKVYKKFLTLS